MPPEAVVIACDAHLGHAPETVEQDFVRFLHSVPGWGNHLVLNGDLFDFWFEYRRVIPRGRFRILSGLQNLRERGVRLTVIGGNHDRWGGQFWTEELGAQFYPGTVDLELNGRRAFLAHGDGLSETRFLSRIMHGVTRHPLTVSAFRWLHPDVGFWLADRLSLRLAEQTRDGVALDRAAKAQEAFARDLLSRRRELDLVILGHTHRPALVDVGGGRWYLNPGGWMDGKHYALLTGEGPSLHRFG